MIKEFNDLQNYISMLEIKIEELSPSYDLEEEDIEELKWLEDELLISINQFYTIKHNYFED